MRIFAYFLLKKRNKKFPLGFGPRDRWRGPKKQNLHP